MAHKPKLSLLDDVNAPSPSNLDIIQWDSTSGKWKNQPTSVIGGGITGFATPALTFSTSNAAGSATTAIRSDATIALFDSTNPVTQALGDSAATGSATVAARRDHKHAITNPLTTKGDIIVGGASGAINRLGVGSDNQVLTADSAQSLGVKWATPASGFADPTTTKGDIIVHGTSTTRLGVGSDGQVLTADSAQTLGVKWATPSSGFADPTTTKGDLIVHGSSTTRLGVGSDGQVLVADSAQTLGAKWGNEKAHGCRVYHSTTQSVGNSASTDVLFDSEDDDTDAYHSTSSNTNRITVPSGLDGVYSISATITFAANATGARYVAIWKNGGVVHGTQAVIVGSSTTGPEITTSTHLRLAAGDYITVSCFQTSGGNLNIGIGSAGADSNVFSAYLIGT